VANKNSCSLVDTIKEEEIVVQALMKAKNTYIPLTVNCRWLGIISI